MEKLPKVNKCKQVGKNLNVVVGDTPYTLTGVKETLQPVKDAVKLYEEKGTKKNHDNLIKLLTPISTEKKATKEAAKEEVNTKIKATKKKVALVAESPKNKLTKEVKKAATTGINLQEKENLKKLKEKAEKANQEAPKPVEASYRRRGEY